MEKFISCLQMVITLGTYYFLLMESMSMPLEVAQFHMMLFCEYKSRLMKLKS